MFVKERFSNNDIRLAADIPNPGTKAYSLLDDVLSVSLSLVDICVTSC